LRVALESWLSEFREEWAIAATLELLIDQIVREPRKPAAEHHSLVFFGSLADAEPKQQTRKIADRPFNPMDIKHRTSNIKRLSAFARAQNTARQTMVAERFAEAVARSARNHRRNGFVRDEKGTPQ